MLRSYYMLYYAVSVIALYVPQLLYEASVVLY